MTICGWKSMKMPDHRAGSMGFLEFCFLMAVFVFPVLNAAGQESKVYSLPVSNTSIDISKYKLTPIYSNDFSKQQKIVLEENLIEQAPDGSWRRKARPDSKGVWILEGKGGADIRNGKLQVSPLPFDA